MAFSSLEKTIAVLITAVYLSYYKKNSGAGVMTIAPEVGIKRGLVPVCVKFISWSRRLWRLS